jgi:hypothetical protein
VLNKIFIKNERLNNNLKRVLKNSLKMERLIELNNNIKIKIIMIEKKIERIQIFI